MLIANALANSGLSNQVVALIEDALSTNTDPANMRLILKNIGGRGTATVLRNDDFTLLESAASLTVGYLGATSVVAWAPAAIAGLVVLLYKYRKKRIELTALQAALIIELKSNGPLSAKELAMCPGVQGLTEGTIGSEMQQLMRVVRADGVRTSLVESDGEGQWRAVDV